MMTLRFAGTALLVTVLALPAVAADADPVLPAETQSILTLNVRHLLDSSLVKDANVMPFVKVLMQQDQTLQSVLQDLAFDPLSDVTDITVTSAGTENPEKSLIIIHGTFDTQKFKETAKKHANHLTAIKEGDATIYKVAVPNNKPMFAALLDSKTLVGGPGKEYVVEALGKRGKESTVASKEFLELLGKTDQAKTIWFAGLVPEKAADNPFLNDEKVKDTLKKIKTFSGGFNVENGITLELNLGGTDADSAKQISQLLKTSLEQGKDAMQAFGNNKQLAIAKELLDSLKVTRKGSVVRVKGSVSKEQLEKLRAPG